MKYRLIIGDRRWIVDATIDDQRIYLGSSIKDQTCLLIDLSEKNSYIDSIRSIPWDSSEKLICRIDPPLTEKGSLDILVPLAIELCLRYAPYQPIRLYDAARLDGIPLSVLKIVMGNPSTTYSKYGFYSDDLDQHQIDFEARFFQVQTGEVCEFEIQDQLQSLGISLNWTLSHIVQYLFQNHQFLMIEILYNSLFSHQWYCQLNLSIWYRYRTEHGIRLEYLSN